jgi:hypothetical protein
MRIATSPTFPFFDTQTMTNADPGFLFLCAGAMWRFILYWSCIDILVFLFVLFFPYVSFHVKRQASWRCCVYSCMSKDDVTYEMSNTNRCLSISTLVIRECMHVSCRTQSVTPCHMHRLFLHRAVPEPISRRLIGCIQTRNHVKVQVVRRCGVAASLCTKSTRYPCQGRRQLPRYDTTAAALRHTANW